MPAIDVTPTTIRTHRPELQRLAVAVAGTIGLIYGLLFLGVLSIANATDGERGILGMAAVVFVVLAALLWWRRSRLLWAFGTGLQVLMGVMYVAISPDRDPHFEVWGLTLRGLSLVLVAILVGLFVTDRRSP